MQEVQLTLPVGTKVGDRYIVEGLLGKGGFGAVYLVRDQRVKGNLFALKEIVDSSKQERARFAFECEVLKRLDHPSLPRVYRVFQDDKNNRAYMLMDYIQGPNLEILRQKQPDKRFPLARALEIMAPIMNAVAYLHDQKPPIIHRDIKPSNIIVPEAEDAAVLVDFGIAKEFDPDSTTTAVRRCSPGYGAPEQYSKGTNTQTDIYGLGATLYTLLTGTVPEDAFYRMTQLGSKHNDPLEPINQLVPGIPLHIWSAIQQAMSINSTDRFQTAGQFWQALTAYPQQEVSPAARTTPPPLAPIQYPLTHAPPVAQNATLIAPENQTTQLQRKKRRWVPLLLLLIVLALGSGLVAAFWSVLFGSHPTPSATPTAVVHHQATATPNPTATLKPTATPKPTATATPTTVPVVYPSVAGTHNGTVHNTTAGINATMSVSLTQSQGNIGGSVTINPPLQGSGPITSGFVQTNNYIQFVVRGYNGHAPLLFTGYVQSDGSMGGQYCSIDATGHCNPNAGGQGTWSVGAAPSGSGSSFIPSEPMAISRSSSWREQ
nr:serine/threonine-protein kinase [Ktedonobacteraceae bacterium]